MITLGKTNTPEFGAGSQTFNKVFGATNNPYDLTKTCGGSSGGAAAAVASGMLPFADGGDLAASLRNPGNYCNVVGFRPTPGRVLGVSRIECLEHAVDASARSRAPSTTAPSCSPAWPAPTRARRRRSPSPATIFLKTLKRTFKKTRIAWSRDLGGLPMEPAVTRFWKQQRTIFKTSAASSRTPSPISPARPSPSRPCARSASSTRSAR